MIDRKYIQRLIRLSPLRKMRLYHLARFYSRQDKMKSVVSRFGGDYMELRPLLKEAMVAYHWDFSEFFLFHFLDSSREKRLSFVPEYEKNVFCDYVNDYEASKIFDSKWDTYSHFRDFYHRQVLAIDDLNLLDNNELDDFVAKNSRFLIKPDSDACGRGIALVKGESTDERKKQIAKIVRGYRRRSVVEELIIQDDRMAVFHPGSVNTVRVFSVRFDERVEIFHPFFRIGRGDSVVDNAGAGGIICNIDKNSGRVIIAGDERGHLFPVHPDTHVPIVGFVIPCWDELIETVTKLAGVIPEVRYVGWDLALTKEGWVMIEGNDKGQFVFQIPSQTGFRRELRKICKELVGKEVV